MDLFKKYLVNRLRDPNHTKMARALENVETFQSSDVPDTPPELACCPPSPDVMCMLGTDVLPDLEMFQSYRSSQEHASVFDVLDQTRLMGSKRYLKHILSNPIADTKVLMHRQTLIQTISQSPAATDCLEKIKAYEADVCWLFSKKEDHIQALEDMLYFKWWPLSKLNNHGPTLTAANIYKIALSPIIGILSPIVYFVIPYYIIKFRYKINIGFKNYLKILFSTSKVLLETNGWTSRLRYVSYMFSLLFYFQGIFNSLELSQTLYRLNRFVLSKLDNIIEFLNCAQDTLAACYIPDLAPTFLNSPHPVPFERIEGLPPVSGHKFWMATNFGKKLSFLKNIDREKVRTVLCQMYLVDTVNAIADLQKRKGYCFCKYDENKNKPMLKCDGTWHPSIVGGVKNSLKLTPKSNAILTGPNAGGKSTMVKSTLMCVLLAQTLTVANADGVALTPFSYVNSQISVPDCKGKESLFEAEMNRCKLNLDAIFNLQHGKFAFVVMDEIFNSTNPVEGISGAFAVAKAMTAGGGALLLFTTHYSYLTKLSKTTKCFKNYCMNVERDPETGEFTFLYKLQRGVSKQYIALELLERNGFLPSVIQEAKTIRESLVRV